MWLIYAVFSAVFAALTSILAKVGIEGVDSNLATAIRTVVVVGMAWLMVFVTHAQGGLVHIGGRSWLSLVLSGFATGASWLCYYKALQMGSVSKVVPVDKMSTILAILLAVVIFHEEFTVKTALATLLITGGTLLMVL
ncbi:MAG: EamA family transporter [Bacteroidales bacterium]|nr:EamA family transporter [Bacteroidales bacterium]